MASAEHLPKKRKLYEPYQDHPPVFPQYHHPHPHQQQQGFAPPPPAPPPSLPPDEIHCRRRNRDEIRKMYESYRRIKYSVSQKDPRLMGELERDYLSLITASRGCTSIQRVVAELIPRYASYCPTALEAAAKVSINMYSWNFSTIMRGEDLDGVAYQTAKACIFGLVDICSTASNEAPTSSVIQGICSAVFQNVLTFFTSTFEGKDIYEIGSQEILKLQEPTEFFYLKQDKEDNNEPILYKLFKFRALTLLRIFFSFPKNLLAACFELLSSGNDAVLYKRGEYFLNQVTSRLNTEDVAKAMGKINDEASLCRDSTQISTDFKGTGEVKPLSHDGCASEKSSLLADCFMGMVAKKDQSLRRWTLTRYKKLCESLGSPDIPDVSSMLEKIFGQLSQMDDGADYEDSEDDKFDSSNFISPSYLVHKTPIQHNGTDMSGKDCTSVVNTTREGHFVTEDDIDQNRKPYRSAMPADVDAKLVVESFVPEGERSVRTKNIEIEYHEHAIPEKAFTPKGFEKKNVFPSVTRNQADLVDDDSGESHIVKSDKNKGSSIHVIFPGAACASKDTPNISPFTQKHLVPECHVSSSQVLWYCDGDPASMEIFSASKQLWISSLGHDASETLIKLQFEDFGPLDQCYFFRAKDFALVEYRSIMDAVKAREYMQSSSLWGGCLHIRFLDRGLGSRGAVNGVAVGDSCHVYIGKVFNQWTKDEIMHEFARVGMRTPRSVTDLLSEKALLLEFWTTEEATAGMDHIRRQRRKAEFHIYPNNSLSLSARTKDKFNSGCRLLVRQLDASITDDELINAFSRFGELTGWHFNRPTGCCLIDFQSYEAADLAKINLHGARFGSTYIHVEVKIDDSQTSASSMLLSPHATKYSVNSFRSRISHVDACSSDLESTRGNPYGSSFTNKLESRIHNHAFPRAGGGKLILQAQSAHSFQSSWTAARSSEIREIGSRQVDDIGSNKSLNLSYAEGPTTSHDAEHFWQNDRQEIDSQFMAQGTPSISTYGASIVPPPVPGPALFRPMFQTSGSSWDARVQNQPMSSNQSLVPNSNHHVNAYPVAPFIPSSATSISHLSGGSMKCFNVPSLPSAVLPPPQFDVPALYPPPPLPLSLPPSVPPPPSSPPPIPEPFSLQLVEEYPHYQWQGSLSKSGVHYCSVYAVREDSTACRYSNAIPEPVDWPARLDVTKRTDVRHVKTTFGNTPPEKREVCRLLPSSASDQNGFHDFILYLKQRECAGVIKVPAGKGIWARLLFILPCSPDTCSILAIAPHPDECLIALVLPKETNPEVA